MISFVPVQGGQSERHGKHGGTKHAQQGGDLTLTSTLKDLCEVSKVDPKGKGSVTAEMVEAVSAKVKGDEADVRAVHRLHADAAGADVPVHLGAELFDRVDELLEQTALR